MSGELCAGERQRILDAAASMWSNALAGPLQIIVDIDDAKRAARLGWLAAVDANEAQKAGER